MEQTLHDLQILVNELNSTNSSNDKKVILAKHPECKAILKYTYNPFWKYNVTSANCKKRSDLVSDWVAPDIFGLLNVLLKREATGHNAIGRVNAFVKANSEYEDLIWLIIDRNLKTKTDASIINKVWKGLVPEFDVALAQKYDDKTSKKVSWDGSWFGSRKLDGIRVIAVVDDSGEATFYSRAGNEFTTLNVVKEAILNAGIKSIVLDGELCIIDENGNEDFKSAVSQIKRKDYTIENPRYKLFDALKPEEFEAKEGTIPLRTRLKVLKATIPTDNPYLSVLEQIPMTEETFAKLQQDVADGGWEGCMLRKDCGYEGKRTNNLLKVKKFFDDEFVVEDVEMGKKPMLNEQGLSEEVDCLAAVKVTYKGNVVSVGSGFSDADRLKYFNNPKEIIGKTITVQYFEESCDKDGKVSLRFPTVKAIYENGRNV